jgi:hypothetical protein
MVEFEMLKYLFSNWEPYYDQCFGSLEDFISSHHLEFHLIHEGSGFFVGERIVEVEVQELYEKEENSSTRLGIRIEDFFQFPSDQDEQELAYIASLARVRQDINLFFSSSLSSSLKGVFQDYGSLEFERYEWLGDAVLNLELTISLLTDLPFHHELLSQQHQSKVSSLLTSRSAAGRNWTLALLYEELQLSQLSSSLELSRPSSEHFDFKMKGDIFESLLGELYTSASQLIHGDEEEKLQDLTVNVIRSIVSFSLYRSQFLRSQEEIDLRMRTDISPRETVPSFAALHPTSQIISQEMKSMLSSLIPPEVTLDELVTKYLSILQETQLKWIKFINQGFKSSKGTLPVSITPRMRYVILHHPFIRRYPPMGKTCLSHLLLLFQSYPEGLNGDENSIGRLYLLTSFDDIRPSHPQLFQDPEWKVHVVEYWKRVIQGRFIDSLGTNMVSGREIRYHFDHNHHLHDEHPEITKKEYLKTIFSACCSQDKDENSPSHVCGKKCDEIWPIDRDLFSTITVVKNYRQIQKIAKTLTTGQPVGHELMAGEFGWISKGVNHWVSEIISSFRMSRGLEPFPLRKILSHRKFPPGVSASDYFRVMEYVLRRHPAVRYQYRQIWKDQTEIPQGPCFWPVIHIAHCVQIQADAYFIPVGELMMRDLDSLVDSSTNCSHCDLSLPIGHRTPYWYTHDPVHGDAVVDDVYILCKNCLILKLETFVVESLQSLRENSPIVFRFLSQHKSEINSSLKQISKILGLGHQLIFSYLGSTSGNSSQLLLKLIKLSIEKEAIESAKRFLTQEVRPREEFIYEGKAVLELKELAKIMRWMEKYQYLGDMESFFLSNQQLFRVLEEKETGIKLVREVSSQPQQTNTSLLLELKEKDEKSTDEQKGSVSNNTSEEAMTSPYLPKFISTYEALIETYKKFFNFQSFTTFDIRTNQTFDQIPLEEIQHRQKISHIRSEIHLILRDITCDRHLMRDLRDSLSNECQLMVHLGDSVLHMELTRYLFSLESLSYWSHIKFSAILPLVKSSSPSTLTSISSSTPTPLRLPPGVLSSLRQGLESIHLISFLVDELQMMRLCHEYGLFQDLFQPNHHEDPYFDLSSDSSQKIKNKIFRLLIGIIYHWRFVAPLRRREAPSFPLDAWHEVGVEEVANGSMYLDTNGHEFILSLVELLASRSQYLLNKYFP